MISKVAKGQSITAAHNNQIVNAINQLDKSFSEYKGIDYSSADAVTNPVLDLTEDIESMLTDFRMSDLPKTEIDGDALPGYDNKKPLFLGHYWMRGTPHLQSRHIACVDWTVVEPSGLMAAYRFDGEQQLCDSKFVAV